MSGFERSDPSDGFRAVPQRHGDVAWLELVLYSGGEPAEGFGPPAVLARWDSWGPRQRGELARLLLLAQAFCRYLNTGGSWAELGPFMRALLDGAPGGRVVPGCFLYDSQVNLEGQFEHVFLREDGSGGYRWVEHSFIDPLDPEAVMKEYGRDDDGGPWPGDDGQDGGPDLLGPEGLPGPG